MSEFRERFPLLRKRLDQDGCTMTTDEFNDAVHHVYVNNYRCADEDILHQPDEAKQLCNLVRQRVGCHVQDYTILRALTNARKAERYQFEFDE